jgi:hypothetical protein
VKVDDGRTFALIMKISQDANTPVRLIAQQLVESRGAVRTQG